MKTFSGYHHARVIAAGESYDERNIGTEEYPVLAPRRPRGIWARPEDPQGLIAKDTLCYVSGSRFVMDGRTYDLNLSTDPADCPKKMVSMGAYVIILPDKKYINTKDPDDCGCIEAGFVSTGTVQLMPCDVEGAALQDLTVSASPPESAANGAYWLDTGSSPNTLSRWSDAEGIWVQVTSTYVAVTAEGIGRDFAELDGIAVSGGEEDANLKSLMGSNLIWRRQENTIVITGLLPGPCSTGCPITLRRTMPRLDYVIESGNRLWGCRYGEAENGEFVNEIYASKLGDFKNWNVFQGISTDSWVGSCGSDGPWTGAASFLGSPIFFKQGHIHRVSGTLPSRYAISDTLAPGVQSGSGESLQNVGSVLLYLSDTAVCMYDGSMPREVSEPLGTGRYHGGRAGSLGDTYYLSVLDEENAPVLFTYSLKRGIWHRQDDLRPLCWCAGGDDLYCIDEKTGRILSIMGAGEPEQEPMEWEVTSGELGLEKSVTFYTTTVMPEAKYISLISLRLQMEPGASLTVSLQYDGASLWEKAAEIHGGSTLRSAALPIRPRRCDFLRIRIHGTGVSRIYSLVYRLEGGSLARDSDGAVLDF